MSYRLTVTSTLPAIVRVGEALPMPTPITVEVYEPYTVEVECVSFAQPLAYPHYAFDYWEINGEVSRDNPITLRLEADTTLNAVAKAVTLPIVPIVIVGGLLALGILFLVSQKR